MVRKYRWQLEWLMSRNRCSPDSNIRRKIREKIPPKDVRGRCYITYTLYSGSLTRSSLRVQLTNDERRVRPLFFFFTYRPSTPDHTWIVPDTRLRFRSPLHPQSIRGVVNTDIQKRNLWFYFRFIFFFFRKFYSDFSETWNSKEQTTLYAARSNETLAQTPTVYAVSRFSAHCKMTRVRLHRTKPVD